MTKRIISASLSPNTEDDDVRLSWRVLMTPWQWKRGEAIHKTERWFEENFNGFSALSFNSGRSALLAILQAFSIGGGDEVLLQAFTCVAVPNSVLWAGAKPIYVDIDTSLNIDISDAEKKCTSKTRAIIVQHTMGNPAAMEQVTRFAKKHNLILIEDCAHSLGATYRKKKLGTYGDAAFFSFGRDKVISSVFGGMAIVADNRESEWTKLQSIHAQLRTPSYGWILQQILHPIAFSMILPSYTGGFGKLLLVALQKLRLLSFPVYKEEKQGRRPLLFPMKYPNALALLVLNQLPKIKRYNENRRSAAAVYRLKLHKTDYTKNIFYREDAIYLRFSIAAAHPSEIIARAKRAGILLGNWYHGIIDPAGVDFHTIGYEKGSCPAAEQMARHIVNLPTNITNAQAQNVVDILV